MSSIRDRKHLLLPYEPTIEPYRPHNRRISSKPLPRPDDPQKHAAQLMAALQRAKQESDQLRDQSGISISGAQHGIYVEFDSYPGVDLKLESMESRRYGIELVATRKDGPNDAPVQMATVFVPDGALQYFLTKLEQYATELTPIKKQPRNSDLIDRIAALRRATLRALWTDDPTLFPDPDQSIWWEVWLRRQDGDERSRFLNFARKVQLTVGERQIVFDERMVMLAFGTPDQLTVSLEVLNDVAEVRRAKETPAFFHAMPQEEQIAWMADLIVRTVPPSADAPAVCVLDTGVTQTHPLLKDLIDPSDAMAVDPAWGGHDNGGGPGSIGHGTEMMGLAAYGDLVEVLSKPMVLHLRHRLESVKILPPQGANRPELYGAITAQAVSLPEINQPRRLRVFSLAVTAPDQRDQGQPTSWSSAIDALAVGRGLDPVTQGLYYLDNVANGKSRLFIVSAGNVDASRLSPSHLDRSDLEAVHDPAQAWNAITVGAYTDKVVLTDPSWNGWQPVAPAGELSPWSTTSVTFQGIWPIKPDVVFEGGNVVRHGADLDFPVADLSVLSTHHRWHENPFALSWATSAATAQIARMAAMTLAEYPSFWPETVRGLLVHSARWTAAMNSHMRGKNKRDKGILVRRYGFGVPNLARALRSANDALTLVIQGILRPFNHGKMREMHLYQLPWPTEVLSALGETPVRLRVVLSYFIEPNPARRGWKSRYRYASHGFRFGIKLPLETTDGFRKRLNQQALAEDEDRPKGTTDSAGWLLGDQIRNKGSLHCDIWEGTAIDLAQRNVIGVYPVSGWWKDQPSRDRSEVGTRYALLVGIEVDAENIDIWTPVAHKVGIPVDSVPLEY